MRIGEIEEEGERAIPGYTPPKPGALPPAVKPVSPPTQPVPVKTPEKEKEHA